MNDRARELMSAVYLDNEEQKRKISEIKSMELHIYNYLLLFLLLNKLDLLFLYILLEHQSL